MRSVSSLALGALFILLAVGTIDISVVVADEDLDMVFHVEGMT